MTLSQIKSNKKAMAPQAGSTQSTSSKHIAFFLPELAAGGAERVFITLSGALADRGHKVEMLLARQNGALLSDVHKKVKIVSLTNCGPGSPSLRLGLQTLWGLTRYLRLYKPDVLFSTLTGANLVAILAKKFSKTPTKIFVREAATLANVKSKVRLTLMRRLYPKADGIIALTSFMRQEMKEDLNLHGFNIQVIGNPVDENRIHHLATQKLVDKTRQYHPYIVVVGRLSPQKDIVTAINALKHLRMTNQLIDLVVVGEGPLLESLKAHSREQGLEKHVHFVGFQKNPYPWIASAKVFVLSSRWEGYPNVLFEALSLGRPVVVTEYDPSVKELTFNMKNTVTVPVADPENMSKAIRELLEKPPISSNNAPIIKIQKAVKNYESLIFQNQ